MCLQRAASTVRPEMFTESYIANGSLSQNCQRGSIPQTLLALVNMILEGPKAKCQSTRKASQATLTLTNASTTTTVDNIDHNTSSTATAVSLLHGTSISLIQHPTEEGEGLENASCKSKEMCLHRSTAIQLQ